MTVRIAMWSGPRNVSTALMRSFEARGDCAVVDEPLYAAYLAATGVDHPGREAILASQPTDPHAVVAALTGAAEVPVQYEKHMAHHWPPGWSLPDIGEARHAFLVRSPRAMVASYAAVRALPRAEDLGLVQQVALARAVDHPVVIDGDQLRREPGRWLRALCAALDLDFRPAMLQWPAGPRPTDGVWAPHWYAQVEASTGFVAPGPPRSVPEGLEPLVAELTPAYEELMGYHLTAPGG